MITKKTYPVMRDRSSESQGQQKNDVVLIEKTVTEYRLFGILLLRKELIMPIDCKSEYVYKI